MTNIAKREMLERMDPDRYEVVANYTIVEKDGKITDKVLVAKKEED